MAVNFKLVSEFQTIHRRSFSFADPDILKPVPPAPKVPIVEGEFLELDTAYKMARGTVDPAVVPSFAYFAEQGRYEVQAIQKGPFLFMGDYEADTLIMDATGLALGDGLEVATVTIGGLDRRALQKATTGYVLGRVTRLPANNNGYLRFMRVNN